MQETQETQAQSLGGDDPLEKEVAFTPVFLTGKFHGQRSLVGYSPWDHKRDGHNLAIKQQNILQIQMKKADVSGKMKETIG